MRPDSLLDLSRNKKGQVKLTRTWRICFFKLAPKDIRLREYEGVSTGPGEHSPFLDWMVCFTLLCFFLVPGILWFFLVMTRSSYFVALTKNHGYPECILYQGLNQEMVNDIAVTLEEVAGLPKDLYS